MKDDITSPASFVERDAWTFARAWTSARIALGRVGPAPPLKEVLEFQLAHARAKDAVTRPCAMSTVRAEVEALGVEALECTSQAADRSTYVRRPDLGRRLDPTSERALAARSGDYDLCLVVGDGLSSLAVERNAVAVVGAFFPLAKEHGVRLSPTVLATHARVALSDPIGRALGARAAAMLIGERPGLASPDSLGIYFTWNPHPGRTDAERNCISNIREGGLGPLHAATALLDVYERARSLGRSGVALGSR